MAFIGNGQRLVGNDGKIIGAVKGAEVTGDGIASVPEGRHIITAIDASTGYPSNSGATGAADIEVGYIFEVRSGDTPIVPETGDKYVPLTETDLCDINAWSLEFASDEIEVTTFCDDTKVYEVGKTDATGSVSGIVTIGLTDSVEEFGLARRFMDIIRQDGGDTIDLYQALQQVVLVELVSNQRDSKGDFIEYFAPANLFGFSLTASTGAEAQTFESPLRIGIDTAGAAEVQIKAALYRFARG